MNNIWIDKYAKYIVAFFSIVFFAIGLYRLGFLSYWIDEAFFYQRAYNYVNYGDNLFVGYDNNGVLIAIILAGFFKLFGASDFIGRFANLLVGTMCIPMLYNLGKTLFNKYVGVYGAALMTFSLYVLFLSRLCRYFTVLEFTQILLLLNFYLAFEAKTVSGKAPQFFIRNSISPLYLALLPFTFFLAMLGGQLNSFFVFGTALYFFLMYFINIRTIKYKFFKHKYGVLFIPALVFFLVLTVPFFQQNVLKPIFGILNNENNYQTFMPNKEFLLQTFKSSEELFKVFKVYLGVPFNDYRIIPYFGFLGIIVAFFMNKKLGVFILSYLVFPLLLMSFVYRDFVHPRFMIFLYPMILLTFAVFLYKINEFIYRQIKTRFNKEFQIILFGVTLLIIIIAAPLKETYAMLNVKLHGRVIKNELFYGAMANWRGATDVIKEQIGKDDILLVTDYLLCNHYLGSENKMYHFRQMHSNGTKKIIEKNEVDYSQPNASSLEALIKLVMYSKTKIWLIADYYLYNMMTDPAARKFIERNFKYHFNVVPEGDITLWSYNPNNKEKPKNFVVDIGKPLSYYRSQSLEFTMNIKDYQLTAKKVNIIIDQEGIDSDREAVILINKEHSYLLPKPDDGIHRQEIKLTVDTKIFKESSQFQFFYYPRDKVDLDKDVNKGFVIYGFKLIFTNY